MRWERSRWGEKAKVKNFYCGGGIDHEERRDGESTMAYGISLGE